jgi:outer membrane lipoprotein-sorting protein
VKLFRQASTRRLLLLVVAAVAAVAIAGTIAMAAFGGRSQAPPAKPLAQAIHDAVTASPVEGITARIRFTNNLFPSGSLGAAGSALMTGATGRLWLAQDGRFRLELQSDAGDAQIVSDGKVVTVYDASSNTVYRAQLPADKASGKTDKGAPSVDEITKTLAELGQNANVSGAEPGTVAGQPAYTVTVSPKHDGGLVGSAQLAWDAVRGVPLRAAIYAQGDSTPVLELTATDISYGAISDSDLAVKPPAGAKTTELTAPSGKAEAKAKGKAVEGVAAVQAALPFKLAAPAKLVGLPRQTVRLVGAGDSKGALVVYGQGLGAIVVLEHKASASAGQSPLAALPKVSIGGATGHELSTPLGTVIEYQSGGVETLLAGSLPSGAAEAAARGLR